MKISAVYKITNTVTNDFYIGSSKDVKKRWTTHKSSSRWKKYQNNPLYLDMQKYGVDKFDFQILTIAEPEHLKESEQQFIEKLKPTYNYNRSKGWDIEKCKKAIRKYKQSEKGKEANKKSNKKYFNQLCYYNGETLTLCALSARFRKSGIEHPTLEAKKYIL